MTQLNKINIDDTNIYDIASSSEATNNFVSDDSIQENASFWTNVELLSQGDMNNVILNKTSKMFRNIRYLKNIVGNGFDTTNTIFKQLNNKLGKDDKISINQMSNIVSSNYIYKNPDSEFLPTSSLLYNIDDRMNKLNNNIDFINNIIANMNTEDPNNRPYDQRKIATFNNVNDVNAFCNKYNRNNLYKVSDTDKLAIGNIIDIKYDWIISNWIIAGFDLEKDHLANDGTIKDNGYGIFLIPTFSLISDKWSTTKDTSQGYVGSYMHQTVLPNMANKFRNVLGSHLINRNVLLSNGIDSNGNANSYEWAKADLTLMSVCQMTGESGLYNTKFDDGEANYKLPLYDHVQVKDNPVFWTRGIKDSQNIWCMEGRGNRVGNLSNKKNVIMALMMIR